MDGLAAHGMALDVLDDHRLGLGVVDLQLDHGAGVGERGAQHLGVDLEGARLARAAVHDAGHEAAAAEPAGRARALDGARGDGKLCGVRSGHEGWPS